MDVNSVLLHRHRQTQTDRQTDRQTDIQVHQHPPQHPHHHHHQVILMFIMITNKSIFLNLLEINERLTNRLTVSAGIAPRACARVVATPLVIARSTVLTGVPRTVDYSCN